MNYAKRSSFLAPLRRKNRHKCVDKTKISSIVPSTAKVEAEPNPKTQSPGKGKLAVKGGDMEASRNNQNSKDSFAGGQVTRENAVAPSPCRVRGPNYSITTSTVAHFFTNTNDFRDLSASGCRIDVKSNYGTCNGMSINSLTPCQHGS